MPERRNPHFVAPAEAGTQLMERSACHLDSGFRRNDEGTLALRAAPPRSFFGQTLRIAERVEAMGLARLHEPHVKHLQGRLWEMRPSAGGIDGRAIYVTAERRRVVVLAAFLKKTRKTPPRWIAVALERAREVSR